VLAQAVVEYGIILAAIAIVVVVGVFWFGSALEPWLGSLARVVTGH